ncbi:short-chain fatty acyl-CoA regulator family protein [Rhodococcus sp. NPDC055112]
MSVIDRSHRADVRALRPAVSTAMPAAQNAVLRPLLDQGTALTSRRSADGRNGSTNRTELNSNPIRIDKALLSVGIARTTDDGTRPYGTFKRNFAVGLGCDITHAGRLVYARGLRLDEPVAPSPDRYRLQDLRAD